MQEGPGTRPCARPLRNAAYAALRCPRGAERPASQERTVAAVTPNASATCSSLSRHARRSLPRSSGAGSGSWPSLRRGWEGMGRRAMSSIVMTV
ncbi:hypothetical protein K377_04349 [Streptomyces sp. PsTaAH-137]|nr:hypothetical protein K377_04349 [Streptomyces sp. PsTaAH-137]